jgi:hypothetical protein
MIVSLIFSVLIGQSTPAPTEAFLSVTPPQGYVDVTKPNAAAFSRFWERGAGSQAEEIGVLLDDASTKSTRAYATDVFVASLRASGAADAVLVSGRDTKVCGLIGYEANVTFSKGGVIQVATALILKTNDNVLTAMYQRPAGIPEDLKSTAAVRKLCPPKTAPKK